MLGQHIRIFFTKHPIIRGVCSYAVIWPTSSLIQQTFEGRNFENYDWWRVARFGFYGSSVVAPALYGWVKTSSYFWPQSNLKTAMKKALIEQVSYGPMAIFSFFFVMSLLELKSVQEAMEEVRKKFIPTYKANLCFWPIFQTINFAFVPEKNRVPIVSCGSLFWTSFLAYMKHIEVTKDENTNNTKPTNK